MKEYIEREAVLAMKKPFPTSKDSVTLYQQHFISPSAVEKIPAADVEPVRHGRWKPHSKVEYPVYHCSVCGGQALFAWGKQCKSDYCPNCGAKMDMVTDCNQVKDGDRA